MKEVEKLKRKLKRTKWCYNYLNKVILAIVVPLIIMNWVLLPIFPWVAVGCLSVAVLTMMTLGFVFNEKYYDKEYLHFVERQLTAAETIDQEKLDVLTRTIDKYKENPTSYIDKQHTKSLIKELIKIKKSAAKALNDQKQAQNMKIEDENSLNV